MIEGQQSEEISGYLEGKLECIHGPGDAQPEYDLLHWFTGGSF